MTSDTRIGPVALPDTRSRRIVEDLLEGSGVNLNGSAPWDIQVLHPDFFSRILRQGTLGLGESYMDGWWDCERIDEMAHRLLRHGLDQRVLQGLAGGGEQREQQGDHRAPPSGAEASALPSCPASGLGNNGGRSWPFSLSWNSRRSTRIPGATALTGTQPDSAPQLIRVPLRKGARRMARGRD